MLGYDPACRCLKHDFYLTHRGFNIAYIFRGISSASSCRLLLHKINERFVVVFHLSPQDTNICLKL